MDDGELIERVSQFKVLYDKRDKNFKNKVKRENTWQTISVLMGVTPIECEQRWTVLRNKYATLKRTSKNCPSGSQFYTITWPYYSIMKFLDPFIQQRRTTTNFSVSQSQLGSCYSGIHDMINSDSEVDKDGSEVLLENEENRYDFDQSMEEQEGSTDETQALYENYIKTKQSATTPPVKKPKPLKTNKTLQESQLLGTNKNLAEIRRIRKLSTLKSKSDKDTTDGIINKLGGCLNSFEKLIEKKQTYEDEDFVRSLSRDLSVFTPSEKINLKKQFYECMEKKLSEKELLNV